MPKRSKLFEPIPDEIWFSEKVQKELKELDDAEYRWTRVEEIQPDELTKNMLTAFKQVLNKPKTLEELKIKEIKEEESVILVNVVEGIFPRKTL